MRQSLPARERGLKHSKGHAYNTPTYVAPRAGAWIETEVIQIRYRYYVVAPRAGAWIETSIMEEDLEIRYGRSPRGSVD